MALDQHFAADSDLTDPFPVGLRDALVVEADAARGGGSLAALAAAVEALQARVDALEGESLKAVEALTSALSIPLVRKGAPEPPLVHELVITPDMIHLSNNGFYPLERARDGRPYRWTGLNGGLFGWTLFVDRTRERTAVIEVMPQRYAGPQHAEAMLAYVDGRPFQAPRDKATSGVRFQVVLPPRMGGDPTELRFQAPVWTPTDLRPDSKDRRQLGVAFLQLAVR